MRSKTVSRSIFGLAVVMAGLCFILARAGSPAEQSGQMLGIQDIPPTALAVYAQEQRNSGTPWVLLAAADMAEETTPDAVRAKILAETMAGAADKGCFDDPIHRGLDALGRYRDDRTFLKSSALYLLEMESLYHTLSEGVDPAPGATAKNDWLTEGCDWCTLSGGDSVRAVYDGKVMASEETTITIQFENGWSMRFSGLTTLTAVQGQTVKAGQKIGEGSRITAEFWVDGRAMNPYPYLLLWQE